MDAPSDKMPIKLIRTPPSVVLDPYEDDPIWNGTIDRIASLIASLSLR